MGIIVRKTNNLAEQERRTNQANVARCSQSKKWMPTNEREMKLFLGLIILQRTVQKPNLSCTGFAYSSLFKSNACKPFHFVFAIFAFL